MKVYISTVSLKKSQFFFNFQGNDILALKNHAFRKYQPSEKLISKQLAVNFIDFQRKYCIYGEKITHLKNFSCDESLYFNS